MPTIDWTRLLWTLLCRLGQIFEDVTGGRGVCEVCNLISRNEALAPERGAGPAAPSNRLDLDELRDLIATHQDRLRDAADDERVAISAELKNLVTRYRLRRAEYA